MATVLNSLRLFLIYHPDVQSNVQLVKVTAVIATATLLKIVAYKGSSRKS